MKHGLTYDSIQQNRLILSEQQWQTLQAKQKSNLNQNFIKVKENKYQNCSIAPFLQHKHFFVDT